MYMDVQAAGAGLPRDMVALALWVTEPEHMARLRPFHPCMHCQLANLAAGQNFMGKEYGTACLPAGGWRCGPHTCAGWPGTLQ